VLGRIFEAKRDEVVGGWRKLNNEGLHNLYCSPNIITFIKSRRMRWAWDVARMGRRGMHVGFWWGNREEDLDVDGVKILKCILETYNEVLWTVYY
jgi:hypothetical protein